MTGAKRSPAIPEVPTVAESGVPGFETASWYGVLAPAGAPQTIVERLNREIAAIIRQPDVRERMAGEGADAAGGSPEEFALHIKRELARWSQVIRQARIKSE